MTLVELSRVALQGHVVAKTLCAGTIFLIFTLFISQTDVSIRRCRRKWNNCSTQALIKCVGSVIDVFLLPVTFAKADINNQYFEILPPEASVKLPARWHFSSYNFHHTLSGASFRPFALHLVIFYSLYETRRVLMLAKRAGSSIGGQLNRFQFRLKQAQTAARQMKRNIPKVLCNRRFIYSRYLIRLDDTAITAHKPTLSAIKIDPVTPVCTGQPEMSGD